MIVTHGCRPRSRPRPVRAEHRVPYPVPEPDHRARVDPSLFSRAVRALRRRGVARHLQALDQGVRALLRDGRGERHHHVVPVRHQLAGIHAEGRQHRGAAARLRGADGVLPRGDFPRGDALGMNRVPGWMHIFSAAMVAIGTTVSAFWILALNSWMQTPSGQGVDALQIIAGDWWSVIFNPSFPYRFTHMLLASGLTAAFVMAGLSAWRLLHAGEDASARKTLRTGFVLAAVLAPLQIFVGDQHGLNTLEHQPAKIAAIEAIWKTEKGVPF